MNHLELRRRLADKTDSYLEFAVMLVDLDQVPGDDVDVIISGLRDLAVDHESQQIRLYSGSSRPEVERSPPLSIFGIFFDALPLPGVLDGEYTVTVQVPISPEDFPDEPVRFIPLGGVHVSVESEEVWLLVRHPSEYPADLLPR